MKTAPTRRTAAEAFAAAAIPVVLGVAAFAVSFSHVQTVAARYGQAGWTSWALATAVDLLAIRCGLAVRHRRRHGHRAEWPWMVMLIAVGLTVGANLLTETHPGVGSVVAIAPAMIYLLAASLHLSAPSAPADTTGQVADTFPDAPRPDASPVLDDDRLLSDARLIWMSMNRPSRNALAAELRARGHALSTDRARTLAETLRSETAA